MKKIKIKKNWFFLTLLILLIALFCDKSCDEAAYKKNIKMLDKDISELSKENVMLEKEMMNYIDDAKGYEKIVAEQKTIIEKSKEEIARLKKEEIKIEYVVAELEPSQVINDTREILGCAEIVLREDGVLFSVECTRSNLIWLKKFSLVRKEFKEAEFALSECEEALKFQEIVSWKLYGALWKMGDQLINLKSISKKKDEKFILCEKQRNKSFLKGVKIGVVIGMSITMTIIIIVPAVKAIFK